MSRLPSLSYLNVATKLKRAGFIYVRTGKHDVYVNCEKKHNRSIATSFW